MDIAQTLIRHNLVTRAQVEAALPQAAGKRVDRVLVEMGEVKEDDVLRAFAEELGMDFVEVKQENIDRELLMQFSDNGGLPSFAVASCAAQWSCCCGDQRPL